MIFPLVSFDPVELAYANGLLTRWGHQDGPINRPNNDTLAFALHHNGDPVGVVTHSGLVRQWVGGGLSYLTRENAIELSRLCASRRDLCRVVLRLWREFVFPSTGAEAAISYQHATRHIGDLYRFDGWARAAFAAGGGAGCEERAHRPRQMDLGVAAHRRARGGGR